MMWVLMEKDYFNRLFMPSPAASPVKEKGMGVNS
jgi:hypothetical protein